MKKAAPLLIIIAASLWGSLGFFTRTLAPMGFSTFQLVFARALSTGLSLFVYFLIFDRSKLRIRIKDLWIFVCAAVISVVLFQYCYMSAISAGSMSIAATLLYTSPIFVTVISAFLFKEKITPLKIAALAAAFIGCILVSGIIGSGCRISPAALGFGIASGLTYGLYSIFTKIGIRSYSPLTFTAYTFMIATLILLPLCDTGAMVQTMADKPQSIPLLIIFSLVTSVVPYICFTYGLKYVDAGKANITATIEPVVATLTGIIVFDEKLSFMAFCGIALVLISAAVLNVPHGKNKCSKY